MKPTVQSNIHIKQEDTGLSVLQVLPSLETGGGGVERTTIDIAEAIVNNHFKDKYKAYSAGSNPTGKINSDIKKFLEMKNYDLSKITSKNFDTFINNEIKMDHVITVCNNANNEVCPIWPKRDQIIHWDIEDPVSKLINLNENEKNNIILNTFNVINEKIKNWIKNEEQ